MTMPGEDPRQAARQMDRLNDYRHQENQRRMTELTKAVDDFKSEIRALLTANYITRGEFETEKERNKPWRDGIRAATWLIVSTFILGMLYLLIRAGGIP